jgi:arabinan endo-1,5-alpha-L-arabinosidase
MLPAPSQPPPRAEVLGLEGDTAGVHDPAIWREGAAWYAYSTGRCGSGHVRILSSDGLRHWRSRGCVFGFVPAWALKEVPRGRTIWAPDVSFVNGQFRLY